MSKEIITPINTVMGMNEMILREDAKDVPKNYHSAIMSYGVHVHEAAESLLTLVNDLLEISRIESGKINVRETEYDVQNLLRSVIIPARQKNFTKGLNLTVDIDQMIPTRLYGDVGKIKQILLNLLMNAIKYTEVGGIDFKISMEGRTNDTCDLCIRVKDTGGGMPPEIIETIFDAYGAFEKDARELHLKTGLGLDISRRFAELMGGVLVCTSEVGKGSTFIFTLTQKIIDPKPIGTFVESEEAVQRGTYIPEFIAPDADVMVASENLDNLNVLDNLLKATKVFVTRAYSRQEFIDKVRDNSFNIAFIDELLFEDDDNKVEEFITKIKALNKELPVYIITENSSVDEAYYKEKGFFGTISLPVDPVLLEKTIMSHLPEEMMENPEKK